MSQTLTNPNGELDHNPSDLPLPSQEPTDSHAIVETGPCLGSPKVFVPLTSCVSLPSDEQLNNPQESLCQFTPLDQLSTSKKGPVLEDELAEGTLKIGIGQDHDKDHDWLLQFIKTTALPSRVVARVLKLTKDYDSAYRPLVPNELHKLKCIYFANILVAAFETKELSEEELRESKEIEIFKMEEQEMFSLAISHIEAFFQKFNQSSANQEMWTRVAACFQEETSSSIRKAILLSPDHGYDFISLKIPHQTQEEIASTPCQEAKKNDFDDGENNPDCNNLSTLTQGYVTDPDISLSLCNNESIDDIPFIPQETDKHVDEAETTGAFECA